MKWYTKLTALIMVLSVLITVPTFAQEENYLKNIPQSAEAMFFDLVFGDVVEMYQFDVEQTEIYERMITNMLNENPELMDSFFKALFASFDDYSEFYTADEFEEFMNSIEGITGGIGVYIEKGNPYVRVTGTIPGGPAEGVGIVAGDDIVEVDGEDVKGRSIDYVSYLLRGEVGTLVTVKVMRDGIMHEYLLEREELTAQSVSYGLLSLDTAYIGIHGFATSTAGEVRDALAYIDGLGVKKIVLDLRDNGGGYIDSAIEIARMFVPEGGIITHYTKANQVRYEYKSYLKESKYTLVTLVNENTASASEILASALQDSGASKLVGAKTFGKAVTQSVFTLYADRACKLTTGEYFTRNGNKINKIGLKPDFAVSNTKLKLKNTDVEALSYCSSYAPWTVQEGISGFKTRLQYLDYNVGEINNTYDQTFVNAVYAYQSANGITPTGVLDITTQIHITNTTDDIEVLIDNQLAEAAKLIGSSYKGLQAK